MADQDAAASSSSRSIRRSATGRTATIRDQPARGQRRSAAIISIASSALHFDGETEDELRACVEEALPQFTNVSADIDGKPVNALEKYRVISGLFDFTLPTDNIFGLPPGEYQAVIGGYFLMHTPFSVGQHVVRFHDELPEIGLVSDVTYMLSVEPHK